MEKEQRRSFLPRISKVIHVVRKPYIVGRGELKHAAAAPKAKVTAFKDYNSAWLALAQGRVDALTGSLNILQGFQKENPKFKIVGELFSVEPFGIGVRQGDAELRDAVNFALQDLWTSGEYTALYRRWFNADPTYPIETWP